jgi:hypothetical protein
LESPAKYASRRSNRPEAIPCPARRDHVDPTPERTIADAIHPPHGARQPLLPWWSGRGHPVVRGLPAAPAVAGRGRTRGRRCPRHVRGALPA